MPPYLRPQILRHCPRHLLPQVRSQRPQLRLQSTTTTTTTTTPTTSPQATFKKGPILSSRRRALLYILLSLSVGGIAGTLVTHTLAPPAHPIPGSHADKILLHDLDSRIDSEFKVKVLRGKCSAPPAKLRGEVGGVWRELNTNVDTIRGARGPQDEEREEGLKQQAEALGLRYQSSSSDHDSETDGVEGNMFTHVSMAGARGLGVERLFWNERDKELVAVVWFGGALSGWPGVTHGGSIATVLGEKTALAAGLLREHEGNGKASDTAAGQEVGKSLVAGRQRPEPTHLELTYKKPTYGNAFYVIRAMPRFAVTEGLGTIVTSLGKEVEVEGKLETMEGVTCVEVKAVVPLADSSEAGFRAVKSAVIGSSWRSWLFKG